MSTVKCTFQYIFKGIPGICIYLPCIAFEYGGGGIKTLHISFTKSELIKRSRK
jgi:hypothetical protein